ncbi:MAG: hypothetical protein WBN29_16680, partial [Polyangiales bacterium]
MNESAGRRGRLEAVELKMDDSTPKLVLSIGYELEDSSCASVSDEGDRDTLPDEAPSRAQASETEREERMHDTPRIVRYDPEVEAAENPSVSDRLRAHANAAGEQLSSAVDSVRSAVTDGLLPHITSKVRELFALA